MTKVKICGLTNLADARFAAEAGADFLGFIFYKPSPRYVKPETVKEIVSILTKLKTLNPKPVYVGVFVNEGAESVSEILDFCRLDAAQLHGDEPPEFVSHFGGRAYKALRPQSREEAEMLVNKYSGLNKSSAASNSESSNPPSFLLDAYHPNLYGGAGHVTDWSMAAVMARQQRIMLAGGLTPANVAHAIQAVHPWGVDVSSGVELEKGRKDYGKVQAFIKAAKGV
jgi:phosphoribosylanthranilate isomerase